MLQTALTLPGIAATAAIVHSVNRFVEQKQQVRLTPPGIAATAASRWFASGKQFEVTFRPSCPASRPLEIAATAAQITSGSTNFQPYRSGRPPHAPRNRGDCGRGI